MIANKLQVMLALPSMLLSMDLKHSNKFIFINNYQFCLGNVLN